MAISIATPIVIIGTGAAMAIVVGIAITSIAAHLGLEAAVKNALDNFGTGLENMAQSLERFVEAVDEATYDPVEWGMDVDQGIRQWIDGRTQDWINNLTRIR